MSQTCEELDRQRAGIEARLDEISYELTGLCLHADGEILPAVAALHVERDSLEIALAGIREQIAAAAEPAESASLSSPAGSGFVPFLLRVPRPRLPTAAASNPTGEL